ncbi:MAG: hypothetical protein ABIP33_11330 [Pseudolysinimonas sp.]
MTIPDFDPARRTALQELLADTVTHTPLRRKRPAWWLGLAAFVGAGLIAGGAVSAAATILRPLPQASPFTIGSAAGLRGVPALPGTNPGSPIVSLLGGGAAVDVPSSTAIALAQIPRGATDVRVTVTCLAAGHLAWGTDPTGNNPNVTCDQQDPGSVSATTFYDFTLDKDSTAIYFGVTGGHWAASYQYLKKVETAWGVNANGQSYGVEKAGAGSPDLLAVQGTTNSGADVDGYAFAAQLQGPQPTSPAQAKDFSKTLHDKYPNGIPVPVYKSDGVTRIGTFYIATS